MVHHPIRPTLQSGNLVIPNGGLADKAVAGTIDVSSGKWYWEYELTGGSGGTAAQFLGMITHNYVLPQGRAAIRGERAYGSTGQKSTDSSLSDYGNAWVVNDRIGIAVDLDNDAIYFEKTILGKTVVIQLAVHPKQVQLLQT